MTPMHESCARFSKPLVMAVLLFFATESIGQETSPDDPEENPGAAPAEATEEMETTERTEPVAVDQAQAGEQQETMPENENVAQGDAPALIAEEQEDTKAAAPKAHWTDMFSLKADLRYRFEIIDQEGADLRYRHRVRARVGMNAELFQDLDAFVGIGTGGSDDPVSNNQTLTEAFSSKPLWLDLAYFDWHPSFAKGLYFIGGKMKNPFYRVAKSELQWDPDLNPEGLSLNFQRQFGIAEPFVHTGAFFVEERKADDDTWLLAAQVGIKLSFADGLFYILGGAGYRDYTHLEGRELLWDTEDSFGNSVATVLDAEGNEVLLYDRDYNEVNGFAEIGGKIFHFPWAVFADVGVNTATENDNLGWLVGASFGKCKKSLDFELRYIYREVEKDAVFGLHTDSDFVGGGTDGTGHEVNFGFQIVKYVKIAATYFYNETPFDGSSFYQRAQFDLVFKFS